MESEGYETISVRVDFAVRGSSSGGKSRSEHSIGVSSTDDHYPPFESNYNLYLRGGDTCTAFQRALESRRKISAEVVRRPMMGNAIVFPECPECPLQEKCNNYHHAQQIMTPLPPAI